MLSQPNETKDLKATYADGTEVRTDHIDATTAMSSAGMDPATGAGNGDQNADDETTAADAPKEYVEESKLGNGSLRPRD